MKKDENVALLAISIDNAEMSNKFAAKIARDGKGEVQFPMLSDPGNKTIDAYGLIDPRYTGGPDEGLPHPAIYILDENRKILWAKVEGNYRIRPKVSDIRMALDTVLERKDKGKKKCGNKRWKKTESIML